MEKNNYDLEKVYKEFGDLMNTKLNVFKNCNIIKYRNLYLVLLFFIVSYFLAVYEFFVIDFSNLKYNQSFNMFLSILIVSILFYYIFINENIKRIKIKELEKSIDSIFENEKININKKLIIILNWANNKKEKENNYYKIIEKIIPILVIIRFGDFIDKIIKILLYDLDSNKILFKIVILMIIFDLSIFIVYKIKENIILDKFIKVLEYKKVQIELNE